MKRLLAARVDATTRRRARRRRAHNNARHVCCSSSSSSSSSSFAKRGAFVDDAELYDVILLKNSCTTLRARMRIKIVMKLLQLCAYVRAIN
jgi:hypothetical protein